MVNRYGYITGWAIASLACASFFYAGTLYEAYNAPKPCISNFHSLSHPWFARSHQEQLEDTEVRTWFKGTADEVEQSGRDYLFTLLNYVSDDGRENPFGEVLKGERTKKEYYVPKGCVVTDSDSWNGPTLWRRK